MAFSNKRDYIRDLVISSLQQLIDDEDIYLHNTEIALEAVKKFPAVFVGTGATTGTPEHRQNGSYEFANQALAVMIHVYVKAPEKDTAKAGLLRQEYDRVQQLLEHAVCTGVGSQDDRNDYFYINISQAYCAVDTPLFDDASEVGDGFVSFMIEYSLSLLEE